MNRTFIGKRATTAIAFLLSAMAVACGGGGSSSANGVTGPVTPPPPATGSTLTWTWDSCAGDIYGGTTCASHSVQFDDGGESSAIQSSGTFSRTFASAGTYTYHCAVHGAAMAGTVIVK